MDFIRRLSETDDLQHVVLAFRWSFYSETPQWSADDPIPVEGLSDALIKTVRTLKELGLQVSVMREVPVFEMHVAKAMALHQWRGWPAPYLTKEQHAEHQKPFEPLINRLLKEVPDVNVIDPAPYIFSEEGKAKFLNDEGVLLYRDQDHLTREGSKLLKPLFKNLLGD